MKETKKRSIMKAVSYRIICIIMLSIVTYLITDNIIEMTFIVIIFQSIGIGTKFNDQSFKMIT